MKRTIYIVEDNRIVMETLFLLIGDESDMEVCGSADTASVALDAILEMSPDLVLTDLSLPGMNGIELIERLNVLKPGQRVVVLSGHEEPLYAVRAVEAGAKGYIQKGDTPAMLRCMRDVLADKAD